MEGAEGQQFRPVEGQVVRDSLLHMLGAALLGVFVLAPLGAALVWAWWTEFSLLNRQISGYGAFLGAFLVAAGVLGVVAFVIGIFRRESLILGTDCLQVVPGRTR